MRISAHYIANVLRTYHDVLKLEKGTSSSGQDGEVSPADVVSISEEGKQRLTADELYQNSGRRG
jgi:hypothetical protein